MEIEPEMLAMETIVPVYFAKEDDELLSIYEQTQAASSSQGSASAAEGQYFCEVRLGFPGSPPPPSVDLSERCIDRWLFSLGLSWDKELRGEAFAMHIEAPDVSAWQFWVGWLFAACGHNSTLIRSKLISCPSA